MVVAQQDKATTAALVLRLTTVHTKPAVAAAHPMLVMPLLVSKPATVETEESGLLAAEYIMQVVVALHLT